MQDHDDKKGAGGEDTPRPGIRESRTDRDLDRHQQGQPTVVPEGERQEAGRPQVDRNGEGGDDPHKHEHGRPRFFQPQPDAPLSPHYAKGRVQLLGRLPRVLITPAAYRLMSLYIEIASKEVGWLGTAERTKDGDFLIDNVFLLEQEVSHVETELSVEGQEKLGIELIEGRGEEGIALSNRLKFWGHSHVRMQTQPSGTDERTMVRFGEDGHEWYLRGIFNKLGRAEFTIYLYATGLRIIDAPWAVWDPQRGLIMESPRGGMRNSYFGGSYQDDGLYEGGGYSGLRSFGPQSRTAVLEELKPTDEERRKVKAEFAAKVTERKFPFWRSGHDASQCEQCRQQQEQRRRDGALHVGGLVVPGTTGGTTDPRGGTQARKEPGLDAPAHPEGDSSTPAPTPHAPRRRWSLTKWLTEGDGNAT